MKTTKMLEPIPPGEILMDQFMRPLGISINALARDLAVPPNRISGIINGTRAITADTALRWASTSACHRSSGWTSSRIANLRVARQAIWPTVAPAVKPRVA